MPNEIVAELVERPSQGVQALIDKIYLYNPDAVNSLVEEINKLLENLGEYGSYNSLTNKPKLDTTSTNSLQTNSEESIAGTIRLHKVSKTGSYADLVSKPSLGALAFKNKIYNSDVADDAGVTKNKLSPDVQDTLDKADASVGAIEAEASARQEADSSLQSDIEAEATTRENEDTKLKAQIDANAAAIQKTREDYAAADETLQEQINSSAEDITTLRTYLDDLGEQVSVIESKIPVGASETNQLATSQQLTDVSQDIRSEFAQADSELQQQINSHATAIAGLEDDVEAVESKIPTTASQENLLATTSQLNDAIQDARTDFASADAELQTQITGQASVISSIQDDVADIESKMSPLASTDNKLVSQSELSDVEQDIRSDMNASDSGLQTQITSQASEITTIKNDVDELGDQVAEIESKIPSAATSSNQLADKAFVNSSINNMAAFYLTYNATGDAFPTKAALVAGPYYFQGAVRTATLNDYAIVIADETQNNASTRYMYDGTQWDFQYIINNTPFTQAQVDAINSEITNALVTSYNAHLASRSNPHNVTKAQVGLGNVDNTSDLNKPISTATQEALDKKQDTLIPNGNVVIDNIEQYNLPDEYTQLSALVFYGEQYVDLGMVGTQDTAYEVIFGVDLESVSSVNTKGTVLFGSRSSATSNNISTIVPVPQTSGIFTGVNDFGDYTNTRQTFTVVDKHKYSVYNSAEIRSITDLYTNNSTSVTTSFTTNFETPTNLYLGYVEAGGFVAGQTNFIGKVYSVKVWQSENLSRHLVPCKNDVGIIGFYDLINNTFYENAGTGTFGSVENGDLIFAQDTTYIAGDGINIDENGVISNTYISGEWGKITGALANQTDLKKALDAKANQATTYTKTEVNNLLEPKLDATTASSTYATIANLNAHISNTSNPHEVTKAQVGLGNVDNTSDINKPVSTAQQNAINTAKQDVIGQYMEADTALQTQITAHADELTSINEDIVDINEKIPVGASSTNLLVSTSQLEDRAQTIISGYGEADGELQTQINGQASSITSLTGRVSTNESAIAMLDSDVDSLTADVATAKSDISGLKTASSTQSGLIQDLQSGKQNTLTQAQLNSANSGITAAKVSTYDNYATEIAGKQPTGDYATNSALASGLEQKVEIAQGVENSGCLLGVNSDGNVTPFDDLKVVDEVLTWGGQTVAMLPDVTAISARSGTVALESNKVYKMTIDGATTFSLPTSVTADIFNQIEVQIQMTSAQTIALGTSVYFTGEAPNLSQAGAYTLIYEYDAVNSCWAVGGITKA